MRDLYSSLTTNYASEKLRVLSFPDESASSASGTIENVDNLDDA